MDNVVIDTDSLIMAISSRNAYHEKQEEIE